MDLKTGLSLMAFAGSAIVLMMMKMSETNKKSPSGTSGAQQQLVTADPTKGVRADAAIIAKRFRDEIKAQVQALKSNGIGECFNFCFKFLCRV